MECDTCEGNLVDSSSVQLPCDHKICKDCYHIVCDYASFTNGFDCPVYACEAKIQVWEVNPFVLRTGDSESDGTPKSGTVPGTWPKSRPVSPSPPSTPIPGDIDDETSSPSTTSSSDGDDSAAPIQEEVKESKPHSPSPSRENIVLLELLEAERKKNEDLRKELLDAQTKGQEWRSYALDRERECNLRGAQLVQGRVARDSLVLSLNREKAALAREREKSKELSEEHKKRMNALKNDLTAQVVDYALLDQDLRAEREARKEDARKWKDMEKTLNSTMDKYKDLVHKLNAGYTERGKKCEEQEVELARLRAEVARLSSVKQEENISVRRTGNFANDGDTKFQRPIPRQPKYEYDEPDVKPAPTRSSYENRYSVPPKQEVHPVKPTPIRISRPNSPVAIDPGCCLDGGKHYWGRRGSNGYVRRYTCKACSIVVKERPCKSGVGWMPA